MGRIRTIKPALPHDEGLGRCGRDSRLLFLLLFTVADDEGRFRAAPALLRSQLFPYDDDVTSATIRGWLADLSQNSRVLLYDHSGESFGAVVNWSKHQRIDKPRPSELPGPHDAGSEINSTKVPRTFLDASATPREASPQEWNGMEWNGREGSGRARAGAGPMDSVYVQRYLQIKQEAGVSDMALGRAVGQVDAFCREALASGVDAAALMTAVEANAVNPHASPGRLDIELSKAQHTGRPDAAIPGALA